MIYDFLAAVIIESFLGAVRELKQANQSSGEAIVSIPGEEDSNDGVQSKIEAIRRKSAAGLITMGHKTGDPDVCM